MTKKQFSVWMDEEDLDKLDSICDETGDNRSAYGRRAILEKIKKETCLYGVLQQRACEDDACQDCPLREVIGKDIICTWGKK